MILRNVTREIFSKLTDDMASSCINYIQYNSEIDDKVEMEAAQRNTFSMSKWILYICFLCLL